MLNSKLSIDKLNELQNLAISAVKDAGDYLLSLKEKKVNSIDGRDIKLVADENSEKIITQKLLYSKISVLAEEGGCIGDQDGLRWIIDPIDGTYNFFKGLNGLFCISVALFSSDTPLFGVIYNFGSGEIYSCDFANNRALKNNLPISSSSVSSISQASIGTGFTIYQDYDDSNISTYLNYAVNFKKVRMLGAAALMAVLVVEGKLDCYIEESPKLWDVAAAVALAKNACVPYELSIRDDGCASVKIFANKFLRDDYYKNFS